MSNFDNQTIFQMYAARQQMLRERLQLFLQPLHELLRADLQQALQEPGKLFSQQQNEQDSFEEQPQSVAGLWPLLTMFIAESLDPQCNKSICCDVAIAVECFICALDLFDDVEDDDNTTIVQTLGNPRTLNAATALLALSQHIILALKDQGVSAQHVLRLSSAFQQALLRATEGQHRDLWAEQQDAAAFSINQCIEIAKWKAGALLGGVCYLGALCANVQEDICLRYQELGTLLGISHQLDNDSHELYYLLQNESASVASLEKNVSEKSDLVRKKKTLPVIVAHRADHPISEHLGTLSDNEISASLRAMHEGVVSTWGVSLLYRERARECLHELEKLYSASSALRLLLGL